MKMAYVLLLTHLYFFHNKGCVYNIHIHTSPIVLHDFFLPRISFLNFGEHSHYIKNDPKYNSNDKSKSDNEIQLSKHFHCLSKKL